MNGHISLICLRQVQRSVPRLPADKVEVGGVMGKDRGARMASIYRVTRALDWAQFRIAPKTEAEVKNGKSRERHSAGKDGHQQQEC